MATVAAVLIVGYMLACLVLGFVAQKYSRPTVDDYLVAGRNVGTLALFFHSSSTVLSGFSALGIAGFAYVSGLGTYAIAVTVVAQGIGILLFHARLWLLARQQQYQSQGDYYADRFDSPRVLRALVAVVGMYSIAIGHFSIQFVAAGTMMQALTNGLIPYSAAVVITALVIMIYAYVGGTRAVIWTDVFQGITIMVYLGMVAVMGFFFFYPNGSLGAAYQSLATQLPDLVFLPGPGGRWAPGAVISTVGLALFAGYFQPHMWRTAYYARSAAVYPKVAFGLAFWNGLILNTLMVILAGVTLRLVVPTLPPGAAFDSIMILAVQKISPVLVLLLSLGLLGAMMSTADSSLMAVVAGVVKDLYMPFVRGPVSEATKLQVSRWTILVYSIIGGLIAFYRPGALFTLFFGSLEVMVMMGLIGMLGMVWPRLNGAGAIWGMVTHLVLYFGSVLVLKIPTILGASVALWALIPAVIVMLAATYATPAPSVELTRRFFGSSASEDEWLGKRPPATAAGD